MVSICNSNCRGSPLSIGIRHHFLLEELSTTQILRQFASIALSRRWRRVLELPRKRWRQRPLDVSLTERIAFLLASSRIIYENEKNTATRTFFQRLRLSPRCLGGNLCKIELVTFSVLHCRRFLVIIAVKKLDGLWQSLLIFTLFFPSARAMINYVFGAIPLPLHSPSVFYVLSWLY